MNRKILKSILLLLFFSLISQTIMAANWNYGIIHQHTGFSTGWGYDTIPFNDDDCEPRALEGHTWGYEVEELKEEALDLGLHWLAFSDHSYCIDSDEFDVVKEDCQDAEDSSFTCLWGEELSAAEIVNDIELKGNEK